MPFNKGDFTQQGVAGHVNANLRLNEKRLVSIDLTSNEEAEGCTITGTVTDLLNDKVYNIGSGVSGNIEITENGENINVAPYATATVNVSGGGGAAEIVLFEGTVQGEVQMGGFYMAETAGALYGDTNYPLTILIDNISYTLEYDVDMQGYIDSQNTVFVRLNRNSLYFGFNDTNEHNVKLFYTKEEGVITITSTTNKGNGSTIDVDFCLHPNVPVSLPVTLINGIAFVNMTSNIDSFTDNVNCSVDGLQIIVEGTPASISIALGGIS